MKLKTLITGAAAMALVASPVAATAQNPAAALSTVRAGASVEGNNQVESSVWIGVLVIAVIVGAFFAVAESEDGPRSA